VTPPATGAPAERLGLCLLLVLALLAATAPLATDFYLPALPALQDGLHTDTSSVQLTLTAFLVGLGLGQVLWGPISDHVGRLRPLLVGSALSCVGAAVAALAPTIEVLVAARFFQALAAAAGVVICRAIIADLLEGYAAARAMSLMLTIFGAAPVIAPVVGGALAGPLSWRWILALVLAMTVVQLAAVLTTVRETLPPERRTPRVSFRHIGGLLGRTGFRFYAATSMCTFGALMSYIASSSFVFQTVIGTSELVYGLCFGVNALGLTLGGFVSARLARHEVHPARTLAVSLPTLVVGAALVLAVALSALPAWLLAVPLFVAVTAVGFTTGNSAALALEHSRDLAGSGSAVIGGLMFLLGGVVSPLVGIGGEHTAVPFAVSMLVCGACALGAFTLARRWVAHHPETEAALAKAE